MTTTALLFDIDKTLTPPRLPITESMVKVLENLLLPFHVAAGSHLELLLKQFFEPLFEFGYRKQFDAFASNGAIHYHCDYSKDMSIDLVSKFDIREYLGEKDYSFLINVLEHTLDTDEFQLSSPVANLGETIAYRVSMVNFTPIGRVTEEGEKIRTNRANFVKFDHKTGYRQKVMDYLKTELKRLIEERNLVITLGGETSFDIGVLGEDKTKGVTTLWDKGIDRVIFFGDALYEGGNDYAVREFVDNLPPNLKPKADYYQVDSYEDTIEKLHGLKFSDFSIESLVRLGFSDLAEKY
jgi:hydroxymethylpyrimidine pyrophosphatase-like HAD family hydrolase